MISGTGRDRGFSLLEILVTLAVIAIFTGVFFLRFDDSRDEELLAKSREGIRGMALKAKKRAFAFRRDHYIVYTNNEFILTDSARSPGSEAEESLVQEVLDVPDEVVVRFLGPGESKWLKRDEFVWIFRDSGLSDPVGVRFSVGNSYSELNFNVLTGQAVEETFLN